MIPKARSALAFWTFAVPAALTLAACGKQAGNEEPPRLETVGVDASGSPHVRHGALATRGAQILEVSDDGAAIVGRARPVPPQSSARLVFDAELVASDGALSPLPVPGGLQDVRFAPAPSKLVALLDSRDALWLWDRASGSVSQHAKDAFPGFAFSHDAKLLAYSRGLGPELDAWLLDLGSATEHALTREGAPVWGFAFSHDDQRLAFVSSREGFPCLVTASLDGSALARLTNHGMTQEKLRAGAPLAPFPDGRRPPIWTRRALAVEDASGVHFINPQGRLVASRPGARDLHIVSGNVLFRSEGRWETLP